MGKGKSKVQARDDLRDGKVVPPADIVGELTITAGWRAAGVLSPLAGISFWLIGARYTTLGIPYVVVSLFDLFRMTVQLVLPPGAPLLLLTIVLGGSISLLEFGCYPRRSFFARSLGLGAILLAVWLLANGVDLASTYVGIVYPEPDAGDAALWVAATPWAAVLWTTFLTYCPELFILAGIRWLVKGRF